MATYSGSVNRGDANSRTARETPEDFVPEILQDVETTSIALQLGNTFQMNQFQTRFRLLNSRPDAYWINGTTSAGDAPFGSANNNDTNQAAKDSGLKQTTNMTWDTLTLTPDEIAVLVPIPDAWMDDSDLAWDEIRKAVTGAFARAIDAAVLWGVSSTAHPLPSTFGNGVIPDAIAAGNVVYLDDHLASSPTDGTRADYADAYAAIAQLTAESGYPSTDFVVRPGEQWRLKRQRDENGSLLNAGELFGLGVTEAVNGTWDAAEAIALTGEFGNLRIGVRQDMTFAFSREGSIQNAAGATVYNALQQDGAILRAVMRLGYVVTDPLRNLTGEREHPFAVLAPGSEPS